MSQPTFFKRPPSLTLADLAALTKADLADASRASQPIHGLASLDEAGPMHLAFFDNEEGNIIHVGIIMENNYIIHAHGKVRIDRLDHLGILNIDSGRHTHKLRVIKKII